MIRRGRYDVLARILEGAREPIIYTNLLGASKLSTDGFNKYLVVAMKNNLIRAECRVNKPGSIIGYKHKIRTKGLGVNFQITEKGLRVLRLYEEGSELIDWSVILTN